jgi:hypothetical protein
MTNSSLTATGVTPYRRAALAFGLLVLLPIALSLVNVTFAQSWKVHFFPAAIFLATIPFGPVGGFVAGITGSLYSALMLGNPYLIVGNVILGVMTGVLVRKSFNIIPAVLLAYACQLPWLIVSDYFFAGLSAEFIARLVVVLFLGNLLWALLIALTMKPIKKYLC